MVEKHARLRMCLLNSVLLFFTNPPRRWPRAGCLNESEGTANPKKRPPGARAFGARRPSCGRGFSVHGLVALSSLDGLPVGPSRLRGRTRYPGIFLARDPLVGKFASGRNWERGGGDYFLLGWERAESVFECGVPDESCKLKCSSVWVIM